MPSAEMASLSLLEQLRTASAIDFDSLDVDTARALGTFDDCTSNQHAYFELSRRDEQDSAKLKYEGLLQKAAGAARTLHKQHGDDASESEIAVEMAMVLLSLQFAPVVKKHLLVQTNPQLAYSTSRTIANAERIVQHFKRFSPDFDTSRVCVKIPSTWEGIQACRELEQRGVKTLATTLFCMEQTVLAGDAKCTYIAPYVNELRVHFDPSYTDSAKGFALCAEAQHYYRTYGLVTKVMAASLTSIGDVMTLAGLDHITVSPALLQQLHQTAIPRDGKASDTTLEALVPSQVAITIDQAQSLVRDEAAWRFAFTRSDNGKNEAKLVQAINIFADYQNKLQSLVADR